MTKKLYEQWLESDKLADYLKKELIAVSGNEKEIEMRFAAPMEFGTAGLRSVMGAGIARMNIHTVAQTTKALAELIIEEKGQNLGTIIAYDSRNNSDLFAKTAACVLAANGIKVYFFESLRPTPELSFALLYYGCIAGINITASHNPKEYNGYKVYWADGAQLPPEHAGKISAKTKDINALDVEQIDFEQGISAGIIKIIGSETDEAYLEAVLSCRINNGVIREFGDSLSLVYTALHGTGYKLVPEALKRAGIKNLHIISEQNIPDGSFPTVDSPNPENRECFNLAIDYINKNNLSTDLIIATDPDGDRLGAAVKDGNGIFLPLSGNQIGCLLMDYIIKARKSSDIMPVNPCGIRSAVSSPLFDKICEKGEVTPITVLTGFKYIGEKIKEFGESGKYSFIFGYEESQGFLSGTHTRDKDAVNAALLVAEAASYYKSNGVSLYEALENIYAEYGRYGETIVNITVEGSVPMREMQNKMNLFRTADISRINDKAVTIRGDYNGGLITDLITGDIKNTGLPKANMLFFELEDGTRIIIRPSGTEPKMKFYIQCRADSEDRLERMLRDYSIAVKYI